MWKPKVINPECTDWYATYTEGEYNRVVPRYFCTDDNSWWIYSNHHDNHTLVPNNSFEVWRQLPEPPSTTRSLMEELASWALADDISALMDVPKKLAAEAAQCERSTV